MDNECHVYSKLLHNSRDKPLPTSLLHSLFYVHTQATKKTEGISGDVYSWSQLGLLLFWSSMKSQNIPTQFPPLTLPTLSTNWVPECLIKYIMLPQFSRRGIELSTCLSFFWLLASFFYNQVPFAYNSS